MSYEFVKPAEYKADDDKKTNQQAYISLENGVVSVNSEYNTSAIGRTPVVRVDAYMTSNTGAKVGAIFGGSHLRCDPRSRRR